MLKNFATEITENTEKNTWGQGNYQRFRLCVLCDLCG